MLRRLLPLLLVLTFALASAQDPTVAPQLSPSLETRITLLEARLARLEADVSRLSGVPTQLARIESQLTALAERSDGLSGTVNNFAQGALLVVVSVIIGAVINNNRKPPNGK